MATAPSLTLYECVPLQAKILERQCDVNRARYRKAMKHAKDRYRAADSVDVLRLKVCDTCPGVKALGAQASKADTTVTEVSPERRKRHKKIAPKIKVGSRRLGLEQQPNLKRREASMPKKQTHCSVCGAELRRGPTGNPWCPNGKKHPGRKRPAKKKPEARTVQVIVEETAAADLAEGGVVAAALASTSEKPAATRPNGLDRPKPVEGSSTVSVTVDRKPEEARRSSDLEAAKAQLRQEIAARRAALEALESL